MTKMPSIVSNYQHECMYAACMVYISIYAGVYSKIWTVSQQQVLKQPTGPPLARSTGGCGPDGGSATGA